MNCRVTQPTKEQVRAYMASRGFASRPPPAPEDIRRQLGWKLAPPEPPRADRPVPAPATLGRPYAEAEHRAVRGPRGYQGLAERAFQHH
jgi:hypothetical protein